MKHSTLSTMLSITGIMIFLSTSTLSAERHPIIFIHGMKREGSCEAGWRAWGNPNSAIAKILKERYGGYSVGRASNGIDSVF